MARNISFSLTKKQIKERTKFETRRTGWKFLKKGEILNAVEKCRGLKKGEKVVSICRIKVEKVREEKLEYITNDALVREGFPNMLKSCFVKMFCEANKGCTPSSIVTVIEFSYID